MFSSPVGRWKQRITKFDSHRRLQPVGSRTGFVGSIGRAVTGWGGRGVRGSATRPPERDVVWLGNSVIPPEYAWSRERDKVIDSRSDLHRLAHRRREHRAESAPPHPVVMYRHWSVLSGRVTDRQRRCVGSDLAVVGSLRQDPASPGSFATPSSRLSSNSSGRSVLRTPGTEVTEEDVCRRCR